MTNAELIAACQQVASLTETIDRYAYTLTNGTSLRTTDNSERIQRWHDNRIMERSEVLDLIRIRLAPVDDAESADAFYAAEAVRRVFAKKP